MRALLLILASLFLFAAAGCDNGAQEPEAETEDCTRQAVVTKAGISEVCI